MNQICRICYCIDEDCNWCIVLIGEPCSWTEADLCSACASFAQEDEYRAYLRGQKAWDMGVARGGSIPGRIELHRHATACLRVWARLKRKRLSCVAVAQPQQPTIA